MGGGVHMAGVILKNVVKKYDRGVVAVKGMNLEIKDGEFVVLVGPSGCGKSTTLRLIAGLETVTSGEIYIGDRLVNEVPPKDRNIAMVFQNYALYPHMTVFENMAFGLKLRRYPKDEIRRRVEEAAEILGIKHLLNRRPRELSGGERQRVAVGRAIVRKPLVFLFDEPLSNLDAKMRVIMRTEIKRLHNRLKTTMVYVTHDQTEAMTMGDRICILRAGEIQQFDDPVTVYEKPANKFVAGFIGSPPMNFFNGKIVKKEGKYYFVGDGLNLRIAESMYGKLKPYLNKDLIMGIRSEDIHDVGYVTIAKQAGNRAKVICEVVEPMGSDSFVYFTTGKANFVARMRPNLAPRPDSEVEVIFDMSKVYFFDKDTEKSIV